MAIKKTTKNSMYLYKYYPLFDDAKESDNRLVPLKNKQLWMSNFDNLNDPTEYSYFVKGSKIFDKMSTTIGDMLIACFSKRWNSLPMWAHYANNHKGFVVQYMAMVSKDNNFYKVKYTKKPPSIFEIGNVCDSNYDNIRNKFEKFYMGLNLDDVDLARAFFSGAIISSKIKLEICRLKNKDWEYEKEYRLIMTEGSVFLEKNLLHFDHAFIKPLHIYAGMYCCEENEKKLEELSKVWGINPPTKMVIDDFYK